MIKCDVDFVHREKSKCVIVTRYFIALPRIGEHVYISGVGGGTVTDVDHEPTDNPESTPYVKIRVR